MTRLHVRDGIVAYTLMVFDALTGERIPDVIWADDEAGELLRYYRDEQGKLVVRYDEVMTVFEQNRSIRWEAVAAAPTNS